MNIGRNDPCPCGSGKKYKKCCLLAPATGSDDLFDFEEEGDSMISPLHIQAMFDIQDEATAEWIWAEHPDFCQTIAEGVEETEEGTSPRMHLAMHAVAENQLRDFDPPEATEALQRLMASGISRHDAIHIILKPLTEGLFYTLKGRKDFDLDAYRRKLRKLG